MVGEKFVAEGKLPNVLMTPSLLHSVILNSVLILVSVNPVVMWTTYILLIALGMSNKVYNFHKIKAYF